MGIPRRSLLLVAAGCSLAGLVLACAGGDSMPTAAVGAPRMDYGSNAGGPTDTSVSVIVIDPWQSNTYNISGGHKLWVRARGVCSLASTYGPGTWDTPCTPTSTPTTVTVKLWKGENGHPRLDFSPALRFNPYDGTRSAAELYIRDKIAADDASAVILYCDASSCVDEASIDPSVATQHDNSNGFVWRRIKHFSGYEVALGRSDSVTVDPVAIY